jgi:hypothetical protein
VSETRGPAAPDLTAPNGVEYVLFNDVLFNPFRVGDVLMIVTTGSGLSAFTRGYCYNKPFRALLRNVL